MHRFLRWSQLLQAQEYLENSRNKQWSKFQLEMLKSQVQYDKHCYTDQVAGQNFGRSMHTFLHYVTPL